MVFDQGKKKERELDLELDLELVSKNLCFTKKWMENFS